MEFKIVQTSDNEARHKMDFVQDMAEKINKYISAKHYGGDIKSYLIYLDITNWPEGYDKFRKNFPPKYIKYKTSVNKFTNEKIVVEKLFDYGISFDVELYNKFINSSELERKKIVASEVLKSLSNLDMLSKTVKDFDVNGFKTDIQNFFKNWV